MIIFFFDVKFFLVMRAVVEPSALVISNLIPGDQGKDQSKRHSESFVPPILAVEFASHNLFFKLKISLVDLNILKNNFWRNYLFGPVKSCD